MFAVQDYQDDPRSHSPVILVSGMISGMAAGQENKNTRAHGQVEGPRFVRMIHFSLGCFPPHTMAEKHS
jgi:hypothetical protein